MWSVILYEYFLIEAKSFHATADICLPVLRASRWRWWRTRRSCGRGGCRPRGASAASPSPRGSLGMEAREIWIYYLEMQTIIGQKWSKSQTVKWPRAGFARLSVIGSQSKWLEWLKIVFIIMNIWPYHPYLSFIEKWEVVPRKTPSQEKPSPIQGF